MRPRHPSVILRIAACLVPLCAFWFASPAPAAEAPAPRAARSVHLFYPAPEALLYYNEATVEQSQRGSYFCACGFAHGYFGIQELTDGKKVVIFSVWDPGKGDDPARVPEQGRVEVLYQGDGVRVGRFGGEGTGAQSFLDYPWKTGETCHFLIRATPDGDHTAYAAYFRGGDPTARIDHEADAAEAGKMGRWKHLATFRTHTGGEGLKGLYSFVEDFRRDGKSPSEPRLARYGNGWVQTAKPPTAPGGAAGGPGEWLPLLRAKFTADRTPLDNVDAGAKADAFYLATGGDTRRGREINSTIDRPPPGLSLPEFGKDEFKANAHEEPRP